MNDHIQTPGYTVKDISFETFLKYMYKQNEDDDDEQDTNLA